MNTYDAAAKIDELIDIFRAEDPVESILDRRDLFPFIDREMIGVAHPRVHCEGDVWDHTALVIRNLRPGHDWVDVLIALFHDAGKKRALEKNDGKNMAGHEIYSMQIFNEWLLKDCGVLIPHIVPLGWVIENHMNAFSLGQMKSDYRVMQIVTHKDFPRLCTLAYADSAATLGPDMKPIHDFKKEVLDMPNVTRWLGMYAPAPIATADDFYAANVPLKFTREATEFGLKLQINGRITDRQSIINGVLGDKAFRERIEAWRNINDQVAGEKWSH